MDRMERIDLEDYTYGQLGEIVMKGLEGYTVDDKALSEIATVLRGNARAAQKMAVKIKLACDKNAKNHFDKEDWKWLSDKLGVLPLGLSVMELQILRILEERKEVRLTALAAITSLSKAALQNDYELYLTKMGLMEITSDGRSATTKGLEYLKTLDGKSTKRTSRREESKK